MVCGAPARLCPLGLRGRAPPRPCGEHEGNRRPCWGSGSAWPGAMAAGDLAGSFQEEVTCPVCLDYFTDPVIPECGHNLHRAVLGEPQPQGCCPQCRAPAPHRDLRPNRQLGNVVELVKRLRLPAGSEPAGLPVCRTHQEALKLFCQEDEAPICVVCARSREHRHHTVIDPRGGGCPGLPGADAEPPGAPAGAERGAAGPEPRLGAGERRAPEADRGGAAAGGVQVRGAAPAPG
ncbi:zinc finger protein RFP-like isoform X1 [Alligator mississippiensis]|uniref:zinc finger protein RFP-like isoform X1 n=1 Tax=Alligator mississippiensis TaxID=8496 RepID=UPI002877E57C|nr:zinc finger protein RFP-like isoform X1 [Alligator mississippiensis]